MEFRLTFDKISEGQTWISPSRTITETDVVNFATTTGDMNPLHVDRVFAENSPWRQPVAHGLLGLSWAAGLSSHWPAVDTVAFVAVRDWVFNRPLFFGDTVRVRTTVAEKQADARRTGRIAWQLELLNQKDEIVQRGCFETLVRVASDESAPHMLARKNAPSAESAER